MKYKTYSQKLKDPRWQKKRLKILERDGFMCRNCHDDKSTLHVHHLKYTGDPWEASDNHLISLCEDCHEIESGTYKIALKDLNTALIESNFSSLELYNLIELIEKFDDPSWVFNMLVDINIATRPL